MKIIILCFALLTTSCAQVEDYQIIDKHFNLRLALVDQPTLGGKNVAGVAYYGGKTCVIILDKQKYPRCLLHEIRHCIEHDWHKGYDTTEDCHID